jgi:hypothetical protein
VVNVTVEPAPVVILPTGKPVAAPFGNRPDEPLAPPANPWNQLHCPKIDTTVADTRFAAIVLKLEKKTGYSQSTIDGVTNYFTPVGWFGRRPGEDLDTGGIAAWYVCYFINVAIPSMALAFLPTVSGCNVGLLTGQFLTKSLLEFVQRWTGIELGNLIQPVQYEINYTCPTQLLGQGEIDELFLKQIISENLWTCWTRAINNLDVPHRTARDAKVQQLSLDEAWKIQSLDPKGHAGEFSHVLTWEMYDQRVRQAKVDLQWNIPQINDCISWTRGRVDDGAAAARYRLDDNFNQFWNDEFSGYMQANGTRQVHAQRYWRNSWSHIPPEIAQRMVWRSRHDSLSWPTETEPVTQDDVDYLRNLDNVAPFWLDKLTALSRPIPNKRELAQMYQFGVLAEVDYKNGLMDLGYTEENAGRIVRLNIARVQASQDAKRHAISQTQIISAFVGGLISPAEAVQALQLRGIGADTIATIMAEAEWRREIRVRHIAVRSIQKRYISGELSDSQAIEMLQASGQQPDEAVQTVATWQVKQAAKGKTFSAAQLCGLLELGLIDGDEYLLRLIRMGWDREDAIKLVNQCGLKITRKKLPKPPRVTRSKTVRTTQKLSPKLGTPATVQTETETESQSETEA